MSYQIKGVNLRVVKEPESGITEVFVTKKRKPALNFSDHLKGDVDIESGSYDIHFIPVEKSTSLQEEASTETESADSK